jgi:SAM-dependent methyltransferase
MFTRLRPDSRVIGVDFSAAMVDLARRLSTQQGQQATWVQADVLHLPLPDNSVDAVTGHSVYYMLGDQARFLAEAMRVLRPGGRLILLDPAERPFPLDILRQRKGVRISLAVMLWHGVSRMHRRYTLEQMSHRLSEAGYARVLAEKSVEGYGVLSRGEKPYAPASSPVQRIAQTAVLDADTLHVMAASELSQYTRTRSVFVLVRQTPDKPSWVIQPDELRWDAALVDHNAGKSHVLTFTALPKAVAFMQQAVTHGRLPGINKVARFPVSVAERWPFNVLLNPPFQAVLESAEFRFSTDTLSVDPHSAVTGEE